jgi:hypothetical protein
MSNWVLNESMNHLDYLCSFFSIVFCSCASKYGFDTITLVTIISDFGTIRFVGWQNRMRR